jgi:hypothetical protein
VDEVSGPPQSACHFLAGWSQWALERAVPTVKHRSMTSKFKLLWTKIKDAFKIDTAPIESCNGGGVNFGFEPRLVWQFDRLTAPSGKN